ncbi:hypothetical protein ACQKOE_09290 [Novosphingobium sp. NPDC080210]|uniref:hypothetical protein n=1 Tax=Novosphingobium sp. NPDC080210 TaxID=3390596 RepID=UPI003D021510
METMIGAGTDLSRPVILNLFQDPSGRESRLRRGKVNRPVCTFPAPTGQAEEWILKQVQDDEAGNKGLCL